MKEETKGGWSKANVYERRWVHVGQRPSSIRAVTIASCEVFSGDTDPEDYCGWIPSSSSLVILDVEESVRSEGYLRINYVKTELGF